jgi:hypothetical protein
MPWFHLPRRAALSTVSWPLMLRRAGWFTLSYVLVMGALFLMYLALHQ